MNIKYTDGIIIHNHDHTLSDALEMIVLPEQKS